MSCTPYSGLVRNKRFYEAPIPGVRPATYVPFPAPGRIPCSAGAGSPEGGSVKNYDTTFIVNGDLGQKEREALILQVRDSLVKKGASVNRIVRWGMRTLAYEIKKKSRGYYVIYYFCAEPGIIKDFERELKLNENILRYMTILFDGAHPAYIPDEGEPGAAPVAIPVTDTREPLPTEPLGTMGISTEELGEAGELTEDSDLTDEVGMDEEEIVESDEEEEK